jgi:lipid II isoglutaminyl synthase (glutamine-hydrolysing)
VSWIWDVDFEPLVEGMDEVIVTGSRAEELALRFRYGGVPPDTIKVVKGLGAALTYGIEGTPSGEELVVLPTYTAMLALRRIAAERGLVRPYWEAAA